MQKMQRPAPTMVKKPVNAFKDAMEKLNADYDNNQTQLSKIRAEQAQLDAQKVQLQQQSMMLYQMSCAASMEQQKQTEVAQNLSALLQSMLQYAPQNVQMSTNREMERALQISPLDLMQLAAASQAQQMLGMGAGQMGGAMGMAGALGGQAGMNMAAMAAAMGGMQQQQQQQSQQLQQILQPAMHITPAKSVKRSPSASAEAGEKKAKVEPEDSDQDDIDVTSNHHNENTGSESGYSVFSGASTPAASSAFGDTTLLDPNSLTNMVQRAMAPNGKTTYSYRADGSGATVPTQFPPDALSDPDVPRSLKPIHNLSHGEVVCAVAISKDSQRVFTGGKGCVKIWDLASSNSQVRARLECLEDTYIRSCKLFNGGTQFIVGGETESVVIFDIETQREIAKMDTGAKACYALALNEPSTLLYACCDGGEVVIFDLVTMREVGRMLGHSDAASCADFSRDGLRMFTGGLDSQLRTWDIRQSREMSCEAFGSQIFSLGCSPTEDWLTVGLDGSQIQVVNTLPNSKERYHLDGHASCVLSLRYAHSGKWFCTTGKDELLNVWRSPYGALAAQQHEPTSILSCDVSSDDSLIVTGSKDKATVYQVQYDASM